MKPSTRTSRQPCLPTVMRCQRPILPNSTVVALEAVVAPAEVYERDVTWIRNADALVAEVSVPSHGVGYEIGYALSAGKRVLCLSQQGRKVSKMVSGNPDPNLLLRTYTDNEDAIKALREFLQELK